MANENNNASQEESGSQRVKAVLGLRGLIVDGVLLPGTRISEQMLAEKLGISRTPARAALERVRDEGLLVSQVGGGFAVASFTESDVLEAIEIRGVLEGTAARYAAERGVSPALLKRMDDCVARLDKVVLNPNRIDDSEYAVLNDMFHELLVEAAASPMLRRSLEHAEALPFAGPNAFVTTLHNDPTWMSRHMNVTQEQHRSILEAIRAREGSRAENLAREHSRAAWRYLQKALELQSSTTSHALSFLRARG